MWNSIFSNACKQYLKQLKKLLITTPILQSSDWIFPIEIMCDAINHAVGVVLDKERIKCHMSSTMLPKHLIMHKATTLPLKKNYFQFYFLEKFRQYLLGSKVIIFLIMNPFFLLRRTQILDYFGGYCLFKSMILR